jgi:hypothetical protein
MSSTAYISGLCPVPFTGTVRAVDRCQVDSSIVVKMGANMSSGHITGECTTPTVTKFYESSQCVNPSVPPAKIVPTPSMVLLASQCRPPTPAQFARFPKVAVPCSVRTELLRNPSCPPPPPVSRFLRYARYQPPLPCPALPQTAQMAGKSQASTRLCNAYPPT